MQSAGEYNGLPISGIAATIVEQWTSNPQATLVVVPDTGVAERLYEDLRFFAPRSADYEMNSEQFQSLQEETLNLQVGTFPAWDVLPFDALSPSVAVCAARLHSLYLLHHTSPIIVVTVTALMQRILSTDALSSLTLSLEVGKEYCRELLLKTLVAGGYVRTSTVEEYGQMAIRGSVIDIFPPGTKDPVRFEFFDDVLESIRSFRSDSQRSIQKIGSFDILPVREILVGEELSRLAGAQGISAALQMLRQRAAEISVPGSKLQRIEEAVKDGFYWPGLEHLQSIIIPSLSTLVPKYCVSQLSQIPSRKHLPQHRCLKRSLRQLRKSQSPRFPMSEFYKKIYSRCYLLTKLLY